MSHERPLIGFNLLYIRPGYMGGTVRYAYELLRHLSQLGRYRLIVYIQEGVLQENDPILEKVASYEFRVKGGLAGRVVLEHMVLPLVAKRDGVCLLFSPGFVSPLWGNFKKVVTIHDLYYRLFPRFVRPWQRRYWRIFLPLSLRRVNAAITVSDSTRIDVLSAWPWAGPKVECIHLGADVLSQIREERVDSAPYCLLVGNITPNKNIGVVLAALTMLKKRGISCKLIIAGNDLFGLLSHEIKTVSADLEIELLKYIDDYSLVNLYSHALCLVQASRYEGFGLPVVEAMNCGCPVIASNIPVLHEIGGDAARYFSYDSPAELSDLLLELLQNNELRSRMAALGKKRSSLFRWRETARLTAELFDRVLDRDVR